MDVTKWTGMEELKPPQYEAGCKKFTFADGSWIETGPDGETPRKQFDGATRTLNEMLPDGVQRQTAADGTEVTEYPNGVVVQKKGGLTISKMPGNIVIQEDARKGLKSTRFPDGFELHEFDDGTTVDRAPDGSTRHTMPNGDVVTTFVDGSKQVESADGKIRHVPAPAPAPKKW